MHLPSPIALGAAGLRQARRIGVPTDAYQTDVGGFARHHGLVPAEAAVDRWVDELLQHHRPALVGRGPTPLAA